MIAIILLLVAGGVFYWWKQIRETPSQDWNTAGSSPPEDYIVKETPEGKIVENKKAGLIFRIPEGWELRKPEFGNFISLYSPDAVEKKTVLMEKGCKITIEIKYINVKINSIKENLEKNIWSSISQNKYDIVKIDNRESLKYITEDKELNLYHSEFYIPFCNLLSKNKLHSFGLTTNLEDKEKCSQEFNKFLETVLIK